MRSQITAEELKAKQALVKQLRAKVRLKHGLPHLYGFPFYKWSREFFESRNNYNFLVAANQIGKSTTQWRKAVHWATCKELWPELWETQPRQFWYLYPTRDLATAEFHTKVKTEILPSLDYKIKDRYKWEAEFKQKILQAIHFNSGVSIYMKTYAQDVEALQVGTCHAVFCDEELPEDLFDELNMRIAAVDGYMHMVFTATLGQEIWRLTMEERGKPGERFTSAAKWNVSMYDCLKYEDGTPSQWTESKIQRIKNSCKSEAEIQRRVYGRFVSDEDLVYPSFESRRNVKQVHPVPKSWRHYCGVDIGSGGAKAHPAAIVFVAVSPDFRSGRVTKTWRGDGILTTASDIITQLQMMRGDIVMTAQKYDYESRDFATIAARIGEPFIKAEKRHEVGEQVLNTLFKNDMLAIYDHGENYKLVNELQHLKRSNLHSRWVKNDLADALRYAVTDIPWDWTVIADKELGSGPQERVKTLEELRREWLDEERQILCLNEVEAELEEWNDYYGT